MNCPEVTVSKSLSNLTGEIRGRFFVSSLWRRKPGGVKTATMAPIPCEVEMLDRTLVKRARTFGENVSVLRRALGQSQL